MEFSDEKKLSQAFAIARFLTQKYGCFFLIYSIFLCVKDLAGLSNWEQARVNEVADFHKDVATEIQPYFMAIAEIEGNKVSKNIYYFNKTFKGRIKRNNF